MSIKGSREDYLHLRCDLPVAIVGRDPAHVGQWCYWSEGYPDEGTCGPFATARDAQEHATEAGYTARPEDAHER